MNKQQAELEFIAQISLDAEQEFQTTPYFKSAMKVLAEMLSSDFIVLTSIFLDTHNLE